MRSPHILPKCLSGIEIAVVIPRLAAHQLGMSFFGGVPGLAGTRTAIDLIF